MSDYSAFVTTKNCLPRAAEEADEAEIPREPGPLCGRIYGQAIGKAADVLRPSRTVYSARDAS